MRQTVIAVVVVIGLVGLVFQQAVAFDLTGTWRGTQVCDELIGGKFENFVVIKDKLQISQSGDKIRMSNLGLLYRGVIQKNEECKETGEAILTVCGGDFEAQEMVRILRIRAKKNETAGSWDAISIFQTTEYPGSEGVQDFATCKWAYERTDTCDPEVPTCP
jgi:hypothetical protein